MFHISAPQNATFLAENTNMQTQVQNLEKQSETMRSDCRSFQNKVESLQDQNMSLQAQNAKLQVRTCVCVCVCNWVFTDMYQSDMIIYVWEPTLTSPSDETGTIKYSPTYAFKSMHNFVFYEDTG